MEFLLVFFIVLFIVGLIYAISKAKIFHAPTKEEIGERGESYVSLLLAQDQSSVVFNDIILVDDRGKSTQIDHIVVRSNGIFVIETKNLAGRVYGDEHQRNWTQVLAYGEVKHSLYNPIMQNKTHIIFLERVLKQYGIYISIIMFPRADLYIQTKELVCGNKASLFNALNSDTGISLSTKQMQDISAKLNEIQANPLLTKEEHVQSIHLTQSKIANNICPRCGKLLLYRKGKNGPFYGCSSFPYCTFTKNKD